MDRRLAAAAAAYRRHPTDRAARRRRGHVVVVDRASGLEIAPNGDVERIDDRRFDVRRPYPGDDRRQTGCRSLDGAADLAARARRGLNCGKAVDNTARIGLVPPKLVDNPVGRPASIRYRSFCLKGLWTESDTTVLALWC